MGYALPIITFIVGVIVFVIIIVVKIKGSKAIEKMDVPENPAKIDIGFRSKFTGGYAEGLVKSQTPCKNGCTRFEFYPTDYEKGENKKRPPMKPVVCKDEYIKRMARGEDGSQYQEKIKLVGAVKLDIPEKLWGTDYEKDMTKEGQKAYLKSIAGHMTREGHKAVTEHIAEWTDLGMNKLTIAQLKEKNELLRQMGGSSPSSGENK